MTERLGEWPQQRVGLFVDTQNLYYAARDHGAGQVDYAKLLLAALRGRRLAQATAYVVEREGEKTAYGFITKLSSLGYRVRRRTVRVRVREGGGEIYEGDWDLGIAADMARSVSHLDVLVLASGDGDFTPFAQLAQERGRRFEVIAFRDSLGQALLDQADAFCHLPDADLLLGQP